MEDIAITIRYLDQDDDLEAEEKLNELELDIEDNVERTARAQDKIASVSRTMAHIRYTMNVCRHNKVQDLFSMVKNHNYSLFHIFKNSCPFFAGVAWSTLLVTISC
jgi:hypothetical protein